MYFISFINIRYFHGVLVLLKSSQNVHVNQVEDPSYIQKLLGIHRISNSRIPFPEVTMHVGNKTRVWGWVKTWVGVKFDIPMDPPLTRLLNFS